MSLNLKEILQAWLCHGCFLCNGLFSFSLFSINCLLFSLNLFGCIRCSLLFLFVDNILEPVLLHKLADFKKIMVDFFMLVVNRELPLKLGRTSPAPPTSTTTTTTTTTMTSTSTTTSPVTKNFDWERKFNKEDLLKFKLKMSALHPKSHNAIGPVGPLSRPAMFFRPVAVSKTEKTWKLPASGSPGSGAPRPPKKRIRKSGEA